MELKVSDLLDVLPEVSTDLACRSVGSEQRIRALTMQKIQASPRRHRGLSWTVRLLVAAVIVMALAVPTLAASGFSLTDWLDGLGTRKSPVEKLELPLKIVTEMDEILNDGPQEEYDSTLLFGGSSKRWSASDWILEISAQDIAAEGVSFRCQVQDAPDNGSTCTASGSWWLEAWNGSGYTPAGIESPGESDTVLIPGETYHWTIRWDTPLDSNGYRIAKKFTYTAADGSQKEYTFYAKFRVFGPEMDTYLDQILASMDALEEQRVQHITITDYDIHNKSDYACIVEEFWRLGDEWLSEKRYVMEDGSLLWHSGTLYRDGKGYRLLWSEQDRTSPLAYWRSYADAKPHNWKFIRTPIDALVGQIDVEEREVRVTEFHESSTPENYGMTLEEVTVWDPCFFHSYTERAYSYDDAGNLISLTTTVMTAPDENRVVEDTLVVHDTPEEEVARVLASVDLGEAHSFSWEAEQASISAGGGKAKTAGFRNREAVVIFRDSDVIDLAEWELDNPRFCQVFLYRDDAAKMWKVLFLADGEQTAVYLDDDGITHLRVTE